MIVCLLVGTPASGKSTWARNISTLLKGVNVSSIIISRDKIRKSLVGENVNTMQYFSKETEVFEEFVSQINDAMNNYDCVFADATHLSSASRKKIISRLTPAEDTSLFIKVMETPFEICMARNNKREGFEFVPKSVMRRMNYQFDFPTESELNADWNPFKETIIF